MNNKSLSNFSPITGQIIDPTKKDLSRQFRKKMTKEEKLMWELLRDHRMCGLHFRRQQIIRGFIADFYCHTINLVIEIDGEIHQKQQEYDQDRTKIFDQLGLRILRFTNSDLVNDIANVKRFIEKACQGSKTPLSLSPARGE